MNIQKKKKKKSQSDPLKLKMWLSSNKVSMNFVLWRIDCSIFIVVLIMSSIDLIQEILIFIFQMKGTSNKLAL